MAIPFRRWHKQANHVRALGENGLRRWTPPIRSQKICVVCSGSWEWTSSTSHLETIGERYGSNEPFCIGPPTIDSLLWTMMSRIRRKSYIMMTELSLSLCIWLKWHWNGELSGWRSCYDSKVPCMFERVWKVSMRSMTERRKIFRLWI